MQRESVTQSILVAACLCLVCSTFVSSAAVLLRPAQQANKVRQMQKRRAPGGRTLRRRDADFGALQEGGYANRRFGYGPVC